MTEPPLLRDTERDKLVEDHLGYVRALARRVQRELSSALDFDELVGYGSRGLVEAARRFDPTRGVAFTTFAHYRIRGAIFDGLRQTGWLGRSQYGRFAAGANAYMENRVDRQTVTTVGVEEAVEDVAGALDDLATVFLTSLGDDELVDAEGLDGQAALEAKETGATVRSAVAGLPDKERRLVEMFYFEGRTLLEAGQTLGLSKSWSSRLHARAIQLLSKRLAGAV